MRGPVRRACRALHALFILWYPHRFRERYGAELRQVFDDGIEGAGVRGILVRTVMSCFEAMFNGLGERMGSAHSIRQTPPRRRESIMETVSRDIRLALRSLRRAPAFAIIAVFTIALGIGANTAIFSVVRGVLLRPLPYVEPDRLVVLWGEMTRRDVYHFPSSPPDLADFRSMSTQLESIAGVFTFRQPMMEDGADAQQIMTAGVTPDFFDVLGLEPMLGRGFTEEDGRPAGDEDEDQPAALTAVILDHGFWQDRFGGDASVVGRIIRISGQPAEIVGVMAPGVDLHMPPTSGFARQVDAWLALRLNFATANRSNVFLVPVGRMAPGATPGSVQREMDRISAELSATYEIKAASGYHVRVEPLHADVVRGVRPILLALMGAVAFVLLVACANVANLLLVRAVARERELAVRASLGGTRGRLIRQLLAESAVLGLAGALCGVMLAAGGVRAVLAVAPADLPRMEAVSIDATVLAFSLLATLAAVALFGIVPALRASRPHLMDVLREGGRNPGLGAGRILRNTVIVAEVALSLVLLVGAGLMARSFDALRNTNPGWTPEGVLAFDVALPFALYPEAERRQAFSAQLQERLHAQPGVRSVSAAMPLPFSNIPFNGRWGTQEALSNPDAFRQADYILAQPGYFETMGIELISGETFGPVASDAALVVVDERLARLAFGDGSAVGRTIYVRVRTPEPEPVRIIGVVRNHRRTSLIGDEKEAIYFSEAFAGFGQLGWVIRGGTDTGALMDAVRAELRALDAQVPLSNVRMLQDDVARAMAPTRFALVLIGSFALIALILAAVGLYGVLSFAVRQRTAEIGVRVAFGAPRSRIIRLVVGQGLTLGAAGVLIGLVAAAAMTRLLTSLLVGVAPTDPLTFGGIAAIFLVVIAVASWIPARRAAGLDPALALREE